jgi:selenide,water dikinase
MVGLDAPDDAAVWRLDEDRALVVTTDFFTPVVDDPYDYGQVAAANALSDLYAMGARPILALNIAAMPTDLPLEIVEEILRGGAEKVREAGAVIAGGHSIQDNEPKYGLVAVGLVEIESLLTKSGAKPGDLLVLSKPLGTGVTTTALRNERANAGDVAEVVRWMGKLNYPASKLAVDLGLQAATDITGFGLLGHAIEVAESSGVGLEIELAAVPFLNNAYTYAESGNFPGGSANNQAYFSPQVTFQDGLDEIAKMLLFDAQTSGGLLLGVPENLWGELREQADGVSVPLWQIGKVVEGQGIAVRSTGDGLRISNSAEMADVAYIQNR